MKALKDVEDSPVVFGVNANTVVREPQAHIGAVELAVNSDLGVSASFNKLDCIGKHVLQDLGEEGAVCHDISIEWASRYPCAALTKLEG